MTAAETDANWIELAGAVNVRDLGGLPTEDGRQVRPHRLIRADNLQGLTDDDVRQLVDGCGVTDIADLRTQTEVDLEGPGPMTRVAGVHIEHLSLIPEAGERTDVAGDGTPVLPWQTDEAVERRRARGDGVEGAYAAYLADRAVAVVDALRVIARARGAALVHCAAGKDRTGVVVATALTEVGVTREAVVADYARSAERIEAIFARLGGTQTYAREVVNADPHKHAPRTEFMQGLLTIVDERYGGMGAWLRANGWTDDDAKALRAHLLDS